MSSTNEEKVSDAPTDEGEKARLAAEARRKRIQQKSADRMKKVSGMQEKPDDEEEASGPSSAARMNAMRRRRFKKGAAKPAEAAAAETTTVAEPTQSEAVESAPAETKAEDPTPAAAAEKTEEATPTETAPKKTYKGVAKMRREMLAKKKQEAAAAQKEQQTPDVSKMTSTSRISSQPKMPVVMYIVTTVLLFSVGLDVGVQHYDHNILVHTELVPTRQLSMETIFPAASKDASKVQKDFLQGTASDATTTTPRGVDEEFVMDEAQDDDGEIDPLFGVDLDKLTKGPGIFFILARFAVSIHRMFLGLLLLKPMAALRFLETMLSYPPVMCVAAVTLRQVVGKLILGAKLPEAKHEDVRKQSGSEDVLTMVKNMVKNFFVSQFPKVVAFYDMFTHAQSDMYVVLCGVFVGLAFSAVMYPPAPGFIAYDEVIADSIPETVHEQLSDIHEEL